MLKSILILKKLITKIELLKSLSTRVKLTPLEAGLFKLLIGRHNGTEKTYYDMLFKYNMRGLKFTMDEPNRCYWVEVEGMSKTHGETNKDQSA